MCRENQFGKGREVCVGISQEVLYLEKDGYHIFELGKRIYRCKAREVIDFAEQWNSVTKRGAIDVCIIPIRICEWKEKNGDKVSTREQQTPIEEKPKTGEQDRKDLFG